MNNKEILTLATSYFLNDMLLCIQINDKTSASEETLSSKQK